jgi:MATE family multidrug resistance protein
METMTEARPPSLLKSSIHLTRLAAPLSLAKVGYMVMAFVDTAMAASLGSSELAALALANAVYFTALVFGLGLTAGVEPLAGEAYAKEGSPGLMRVIDAGFWFGAVLGLLTALFSWLVAPELLRLIGEPPHLVDIAARFLKLAAWDAIFALAIQALVVQLTMLEKNLMVVVAMGLNVGLHLLMNLCLVTGRFGFPELGVEGIAIARISGSVVGFLVLFAAAHRYRGEGQSALFARLPAWVAVRAIGVMGSPIGLQALLEVSAFHAVTLWMGLLGEEILSGSQIALNIASVSFTVVMGVSSAGSTQVAVAMGRREPKTASIYAASTVLLAWVVALVFGAAMLIWDDGIIALYTQDTEVARWATSFLFCAACFQFFDMTQCAGFGVLRGLGDTRIPFIFNIIGYWIVGIPLSYWLVFSQGYDAVALWWGLTAGLVLISGLVIWRIRVVLRRPLPDEPAELVAA